MKSPNTFTTTPPISYIHYSIVPNGQYRSNCWHTVLFDDTCQELSFLLLLLLAYFNHTDGSFFIVFFFSSYVPLVFRSVILASLFFYYYYEYFWFLTASIPKTEQIWHLFFLKIDIGWVAKSPKETKKKYVKRHIGPSDCGSAPICLWSIFVSCINIELASIRHIYFY
mgnify:CR=1 FL=1